MHSRHRSRREHSRGRLAVTARPGASVQNTHGSTHGTHAAGALTRSPPFRGARARPPHRTDQPSSGAGSSRPQADIQTRSVPKPVDARPDAGRDPVSAARRSGTAYESAVVAYLTAHGFPHVERRTLHGNADRGDIAGVAGWAVECKAVRALDLAGWATEATREAVNARSPWWAVIVKRRGRPVAESYVLLTLATWAEAVSGDPPDDPAATLRRIADHLDAG